MQGFVHIFTQPNFIPFQMHALLQCWPRIAPEQALELLDYKYPEKEVRDYAVQCLENFS